MLTVDQDQDKYLVSFGNTSKLGVLSYKEIESRLMPIAVKEGSNVVLNFEGIRFIDSSGFCALLDLYRASKINNSNIKLVNVSHELEELFKHVELQQVFQLN